MKFSCSKVFANYRLFIIFGCSLVFVIQLGYLIPEYIEPTKLNRDTEIIALADLAEFPLVFKFCIRPGWNMTELRAHGYPSIDLLFWGQTDYYDYDVGWEGNESNISPAGNKNL